MRPIPAASARATMASRSSAKSGKSRWQWLSTSILLGRRRLDVTRKDRHRRGQNDARLDARCSTQRGKIAFACWYAETVKQLGRRSRYRRLCENSDLADDLGSHIQHRALTCRIGLRQRPWGFAREITVGLGDDRPNSIQPVMNLQRAHGSACEPYHAVGLRKDCLVIVAEIARLRQHAFVLLGDHRQRSLRQV